MPGCVVSRRCVGGSAAPPLSSQIGRPAREDEGAHSGGPSLILLPPPRNRRKLSPLLPPPSQSHTTTKLLATHTPSTPDPPPSAHRAARAPSVGHPLTNPRATHLWPPGFAASNPKSQSPRAPSHLSSGGQPPPPRPAIVTSRSARPLFGRWARGTHTARASERERAEEASSLPLPLSPLALARGPPPQPPPPTTSKRPTRPARRRRHP